MYCVFFFFLTFTSLLKDKMKDTKEQPDEAHTVSWALDLCISRDSM